MARDRISDVEKGYVGDVVRLEIPLESVANLRRVADELRGLAWHLETISRFREGGPSAKMLEVRMVVSSTNKALVKIRSRGRPKRSRNKF